jgi:hypothetical protein
MSPIRRLVHPLLFDEHDLAAGISLPHGVIGLNVGSWPAAAIDLRLPTAILQQR